MATILCQHRPQMATVRPAFYRAAASPPADGELIRETLGMSEDEVAVKLLRFIPSDSEERINLEYADVIVSGGRGVSDPAGFKLLEELAGLLGGVVGASRAVVDAGWISQTHQVGQTGKTVRPKLYIAAGISGAIQHRVGMSGSNFVLAINTDPNASIFQLADLGIVGDLYQVIPELINQVKAARQSQPLAGRSYASSSSTRLWSGAARLGWRQPSLWLRQFEGHPHRAGRFAGAKNFWWGALHPCLADYCPMLAAPAP
jgi:electron transfer flavoprotein alpha subunit